MASTDTAATTSPSQLQLITFQKHHVILSVKIWWLAGAKNKYYHAVVSYVNHTYFRKNIPQMKKIANSTLLFTSDAPLQLTMNKQQCALVLYYQYSSPTHQKTFVEKY